ncbi:ankyrin repeat domain-containing protein [Chitinophaga caeni]|nr:ankyrin repeat domain-containing protein [Chitinophaga caeni]
MKDSIYIKEHIIEAVSNNRIKTVEEALKSGADVNTKDASGQSLLLIATKSGYIPMAELLVAYGADVNQQDRQLDSPFLYAGATGQAVLIRLFLKHGARFDIFNRYNGSALIPACERGHIEVVKILTSTEGFPIDHINRLGWTALLEAVILGDGSKKYEKIVQILVDAGCNTAIADKDGVTALQHARSRGFQNIVSILERS